MARRVNDTFKVNTSAAWGDWLKRAAEVRGLCLLETQSSDTSTLTTGQTPKLRAQRPCDIQTHTRTHSDTRTSSHTDTCTHINAHAHTHAYTHKYTDICTHKGAHTRTHSDHQKPTRELAEGGGHLGD